MPTVKPVTPEQVAAAKSKFSGALVPSEGPVERVLRTGRQEQEQEIQKQAMPGGFGPGDEPLDQIPNYERLTRFERSLMDALPGIANSKAGQFLAGLNEGWLGKALQVVDWGAEQVERATGLAAQAAIAVGSEEGWDDFTSRLGAAWYAGSLAADFANLPQWSNGKLEVPVDLPGLDGVVRARTRIAELADQGMELKDALAQVRNESYDDAGALALRMQWHDMVFHIAADPLNIALGFLKPVERGAIAVSRLTRARAVPELVEQALTKVDDFAEAARLAGNADNVAAAAAGREFIENIPRLTNTQEKLLRLTGVLQSDKNPWFKFLASKWNPFGLTPQARARELATNLTDNAMNMLARVNDPEEAVRILTAAADGTFDPRVAHMIVTHEGNAVRAMMTGFSAEARGSIQAWRAGTQQRNLLRFMASVLGDDADNVMTRIFGQTDEGGAVLREFTEKLGSRGDEFARFAEAAGMAPDAFTIEKLVANLDPLYKTGLLSQEQFMARLMGQLGDVAGKNLVIKFGVSESGFLVKFGEAVKSAESLGFLRMNPGYLVRNFLNGEVTMLARGSFRLADNSAARFLTALGFEPARLKSGFGIAGIGVDAAIGRTAAISATVDAAISAAARGESGALAKVRDFFSGVNLGKLDSATAAASMEASQSRRAFVAGMIRYHRKYYQVADMAPEVQTALRSVVGDDGLRTIKRAMADALSESEVDALLFSDNLNLNVRGVLDNAGARFGTDIDDVIPMEELDDMVGRLNTAFREGGETSVRDTTDVIRLEVQQKLAQQLEEELPDIAEDIGNRVLAGGPDEALRQHADAIDYFWGEAHAQYTQEFSVAYEQIRQADSAARPTLWAAAEKRARVFWDEKWGILRARADGVYDGIRQVEKSTGQKFPFTSEYRQTFKNWEKGWQKHWNTRDRLMREFVEVRADGKKVDFDIINQQINESYELAVASEQAAWLHMDEVVSRMVPEGQRDLFMAGRARVADVRGAMREYTQLFQTDPLGDGRRFIDLADEEKIVAYRQFWQTRRQFLEQIKDADDAASAAMRGERAAADLQANLLEQIRAGSHGGASPDAGRWFTSNLEGEDGALKYLQTRQRAGRPAVITYVDVPSDEAARLNLNELAKSMSGAEDAATRGISLNPDVEYLLPDELLRARKVWSEGIDEPTEGITRLYRGESGLHLPGPEEGAEFQWNAIGNIDEAVQRPMPQAQGLHELWYSRGSKALDSVRDSVVEAGKKKPLRFEGLSPEAQNAVRSYATQVKSKMSSERYQMVKFGEYTRDAALLNYQRRLNYNTWLGVMMPYEFWTTTSIGKWALHTLDRPFVVSAYMRMQRFLETGFRPEAGLPSRLKGRIRIKLPFLPDWMGKEVFVDPLGAALPFRGWARPLEAMDRQLTGDMGRATRALEALLQDGSITQAQYAFAASNKSGPAWDRAMTLAQQDSAEGRQDMWDFASLITSPHAPLQWIGALLRGKPEEIQAALPIERTVRGITALLGIGPNGGVTPLGALREAIGLPRFDQWDDYRIKRMLSSMAARGEISVEDARQSSQRMAGNVWEEAKRRAGQEFGVGAMGSLIGIPTGAYPPGEEHQRKLQDDYQAAWKAYEGGDLKAMQRFYDANPDYEVRLALWDTPEEQMQRFITDDIWAIWRELPAQHKREVSEQLGELFQTAFLDRETRSTENIPLDTLQAWLKIMGGDPPGMVHWDQDLHPLANLTDPDIAQRLEGFYRTRATTFGYSENVAPLQDDYFKLDKHGREDFLRAHPELKRYWDWRRDFMIRNPTLAPYIEDDPTKLPTYGGEQELQEAEAAEPNFTFFEWQNVLGVSTWRLIRDTMALDAPLDNTSMDELEEIAAGLGMDVDQLLIRLHQSFEESQ